MFDSLLKMTSLTSLKAGAMNTALIGLRPFLSRLIQDYASLDQLSWDADEHRLTATITPAGENHSITVHIASITLAADGSSIRLSRLSSDKLWADRLLHDFVDGKDFPIPEEYRGKLAVLAKIPGLCA